LRIETVRESERVEMALDLDEQERLLSLGRSLAQGTDRYGRRVENSTATLIRVERLDDARAQVTVVDAVGVVAIPGLELEVKPKIPQKHLLHLTDWAGLLPRWTTSVAQVQKDEPLANLIAHWFIAALERVLEEGLSRDYHECAGELDSIRGRVALLPSARLFYRGRLGVVADYEEFGFDTSPNRLLLAGARVIAAGVPLPIHLRKRANRAIKRMDEVGHCRPSDLAAVVDRMTAHYVDAVSLAREVLVSAGRRLEAGASKSWGFLFRTATPVEGGIRTVLKEALAGEAAVTKRRFPLGNSQQSVGPDLVFGDVLAIGDVKYKEGGSSWNRADLYEVVAFAAAAERTRALLVNFRPLASRTLPPILVGKTEVSEISWPAEADLDPREASRIFGERAQAWLRASPVIID
jgi:5-methylcytosine-specific restriction endonuclease McrBC regulatory subunit McrC